MYSQEDYAKIEKKLLIRRLAVYIICGALLCAAIVAIVLSVQDWKGYLHKDSFGEEVVNRLFTHIKLYPLAFILPVIALCALIFGEGIFVSPVRHYRDYVRQALDLPYDPLCVVAIGKSAETYEISRVGAGESLAYYRKDGVHIVPKLRLEDLLI